jgi:hypothetical protein
MIDFWETIGRMALDTTYITDIVSLGVREPLAADFGSVAWPRSMYDNVRNFAQRAGRNFGPVGLAAAGELLLALAPADQVVSLQAIAQAVSDNRAQVPNFPRDAWGCVALGAAITDDQVMATLSGGVAPFGQYRAAGFDCVSAGDRADLAIIYPLIANPASASHPASDFAGKWGSACSVRMSFYAGHRQPVVRAQLATT